MSGSRPSAGSNPRAGNLPRVLLAIPSYRGGGAERVVTSLARRLSRDRFDIHLAVVEDDGPLGQTLPDDVTRHSLSCRRVSQAALPFLRLVRQLRPQVVLTAASHLNALAGMLRPAFPRGTHLIVRETGVLETSLAAWRFGRVFKPALALAYRQADRVIGQSSFALQEIHTQLGVPQERLIRIANPVEVDALAPSIREQTASPFGSPDESQISINGWSRGPHLLGAGRLGTEKGFDRLIQAFPELKRSHPHAELWIIGEGSERAPLQRLADDLGVGRSVHLPGYQPDVSRWMAHADLFVLSSRTESLPNVLLEAVACECPVVALEQVGGTRELLGQLGLSQRWVSSLVPWQDEWFDRPDPAVRETLVTHFHCKRIVAQYEELFEDVAGSRSLIQHRSAG